MNGVGQGGDNAMAAAFRREGVTPDQFKPEHASSASEVPGHKKLAELIAEAKALAAGRSASEDTITPELPRASTQEGGTAWMTDEQRNERAALRQNIDALKAAANDPSQEAAQEKNIQGQVAAEVGLKENTASALAEHAGVDVGIARRKMLEAEQAYLKQYKTRMKEGLLGTSAIEKAKLVELRDKYNQARAEFSQAVSTSAQKRLAQKTAEGKGVMTKEEGEAEATTKKYADDPARMEKVMARYNRMALNRDVIVRAEKERIAAKQEALGPKGKNLFTKMLGVYQKGNQAMETYFTQKVGGDEKRGKRAARAARIVAFATLGSAAAGFTAATLVARLVGSGTGAVLGSVLGAGAGKLFENTLGKRRAENLEERSGQAAFTAKDVEKTAKAYQTGTAESIARSRKRWETATAFLTGLGLSLETVHFIADNPAIAETVEHLGESATGHVATTVTATHSVAVAGVAHTQAAEAAGHATGHADAAVTAHTTPAAAETAGHTAPAAANGSEFSVGATHGHGYEYMEKELWKQMQEHHVDASHYAQGSDAAKLAAATDKNIDQVVHQIAAGKSHEFFDAAHQSVEIDPDAHLAIGHDGMLHFSEHGLPQDAPTTIHATAAEAARTTPPLEAAHHTGAYANPADDPDLAKFPPPPAPHVAAAAGTATPTHAAAAHAQPAVKEYDGPFGKWHYPTPAEQNSALGDLAPYQAQIGPVPSGAEHLASGAAATEAVHQAAAHGANVVEMAHQAAAHGAETAVTHVHQVAENILAEAHQYVNTSVYDTLYGAHAAPAGVHEQIMNVLQETGVGPRTGEHLGAYLERAAQHASTHADTVVGTTVNGHAILADQTHAYLSQNGVVVYGGDDTARYLLAHEYLAQNPHTALSIVDDNGALHQTTLPSIAGRIMVSNRTTGQADLSSFAEMTRGVSSSW